MSEQDIKTLSFDVQQIGKHVKSSKKKFTWKFNLQGTKYQFSCESSSISGKIKLILNGRIVYTGQTTTGVAFQHPMVLDSHSLLIMQQGDSFELRIDNKSFNHLMTQQKTNEEFKKCEEAVEDIKVNQKFTIQSDQKITLNISAIGDGMKKKKNVIQSQNWKQMGSHDITYFQNQNSQSRQPNTGKTQKDTPNIQPNLPQQFNTMQQLFSTTTPQAMPTPLSTLKQQSPINLLEYNTMQLMFATQCQGSTGATTPNISSLGPQGLANGSNPGQFTTMQALFATQCQVPDGNNFNTMQQLFGTVNQQSIQGGVTKQNIGGASSPLELLTSCQKTMPTVQEFNTMRNMFSTVSSVNSPGNIPQIQSLPIQISQTSSGQNTNVSNTLDFTTMQQLFATNNLSFPPPMPNSTPQLKNMSPSDFNTMQNLFSTINLNQGVSFPKPLQEKNQNFKSLMVKTQENQSSQGLNQLKLSEMPNIQDFNTMQNLFRTGNNNLYGENVKPS